MTLASEYHRQFAWRPWGVIFDALPKLRRGATVLDLGCGVGDLAAELARRGARLIGLDTSAELIDAARARGIDGATFHRCDLRNPASLPTGLAHIDADGIWCSFTAAYFIDLPAVLRPWVGMLRPGGWVAITEIDDLFGHSPLDSESRALFDDYARDALAAARYDFHMGRKLEAHLRASGLSVQRVMNLEDQELCFTGPASPAVIEAWRNRFERIRLLHTFCGDRYEAVRDEFLACLGRPEHRSTAKVYCVIATKNDRGA